MVPPAVAYRQVGAAGLSVSVKELAAAQEEELAMDWARAVAAVCQPTRKPAAA